MLSYLNLRPEQVQEFHYRPSDTKVQYEVAGTIKIARQSGIVKAGYAAGQFRILNNRGESSFEILEVASAGGFLKGGQFVKELSS